MVRRQHLLTDVLEKDPDIASYGTGLGGNRPVNNGFVVIGLKPRNERSASADEIITRLRPQLAKVPGATLFMQAAQDLNVGGRTSRTQYQYTLQDSDINELNEWAPKMLDVLKKLPDLRATWPRISRPAAAWLSLVIDRDPGVALRAFSRPRWTSRCTDAFGPAPGGGSSSPRPTAITMVLEITPELQKDPQTLNKLYIKSPLTNQMVPLSAMTKFDTQHVTYLSINHQGQFPAVDAVLQSGPGSGFGRCRGRHQCGASPLAVAGHHHREFSRHCTSVPILIEERTLFSFGRLGGGVHHSRHALRKLHPSADHSVDAALGRRGRAADFVYFPHRPVGNGDDRHHLADRHRQKERHHDGGFRAAGRTRSTPVLA